MKEYPLDWSDTNNKVVRRQIVSESSIALDASAESERTEVEFANYGDLLELHISLTASAAGTLVTPKALSFAIKKVSFLKKDGNAILKDIRGQDLPMLARLRNVGRVRAPANISNSAQTHTWMVPLNVESKDLAGKLKITLNSYGALVASGATSGTVSYKIVGVFGKKSLLNHTECIFRKTIAIVSGSNGLKSKLDDGKLIKKMYAQIGTESNFTDFTVSRDGGVELNNKPREELSAEEDDQSVSGHQTGEFELAFTPFVVNDRVTFDFTGAGADTLELFVVTAE